MTKKDYIKFANALAGLRPIQTDLENEYCYNLRLRQWQRTVEKMIKIFKEDDERFDEVKFKEAVCYY